MRTPFLIGITGASGSGKTTVARELAAADKDALLVTQDNWYYGLPDGMDAADWNFDDPAALDLDGLARDLAALRRGETAAAPRYLFAEHRRAPEPLMLQPAPLIIVEGLFLFTTDALRRVFDLKLFIALSAAQCLRRRIERDTVERGRTEAMIRRRWAEQVEPMYRRHVEPTRSRADLCITPAERGTPERAEQIRRLSRRIAELRAGLNQSRDAGAVS